MLGHEADPDLYSPVGLKEAALDSLSFRASVQHFGEQVDLVEKWLEAYVKSILKLSQWLSSLEGLVSSFISASIPPTQLSETIIDHDYTLLAARRYGEGAKAYWSNIISGTKRMDVTMIEPVRGFLQNDLRAFKETRRLLEHFQRQVDNLQARYASQTRAKEASALREDAFQLHEARKAYLKASMDFSVSAPQLRMALDKVLVTALSDQWQVMRNARENTNPALIKWGMDMERVRGWCKEMEGSERAFQRELFTARKKIEESALLASKPSRELDDYSNSTSPSNSRPGKSKTNATQSKGSIDPERQGWLNLKVLTGKPARTSWIRRWFFVKNGIFAWLVQGSRSGGVEESERIGVLLCNVRVASQEDRRFCFEVKTKDISIVLQAETQQELKEWIDTFEAAKEKALEDPKSTDVPPPGTTRVLDPAFAISPPSAPEFAASPADSGMPQFMDDSGNHGSDRASTFPTLSTETINRAGSFDVNSNRRPVVTEKDVDNRDHGSRLMSKLDLHRKAGSAQLSGTSGNPTAGIASLISASHTALPVGPGAMPVIPSQVEPHKSSAARAIGTSKLRNLPYSTLAPNTLASTPIATNLSATAVMISSERRNGVGQLDSSGGMPSGMMANLWGTLDWGYINRLERGEVKPDTDMKPHPGPGAELPHASTFSGNLNSVLEEGQEDLGRRGSTTGHRKTISLDGDSTDLLRTIDNAPEYPTNYPMQLKHQDAQFHLLFPNVHRQERVVLVFRATWNPNDQQELPGRVYLTATNIYFYSLHLGLVLITGIGLRRIAEVTAAPGRDCDFIFLHLKETNNNIDFNRITIKIFLEPLSLLQRRLSFLVQNANSAEPWSLDFIMKALLKLEVDDGDRSPSIDSWDDVSRKHDAKSASQQGARDLKASFQIDQGLFRRNSVDNIEAPRFKLPNKPVDYVPRGMGNAKVEKDFDLSPKALFHVMFGDKSAVWQSLYHERSAQKIKQGPWTHVEGSPLGRTFEYDIQYIGLLGQVRQAKVTDHQTIDVLNDHLCYAVTDRKTPWHLPYHDDYTLVTKIVITHVAKSKCKLSIYTQVNWKRVPVVARELVERKAMSDLELDALDLVDVLADQVRKLGPLSRTKKAIQIFGYVGQQKEVSQFAGSNDPAGTLQIRRTIGQRTLTHLVLESLASLSQDVVTALLQWTLGLVKWIGKTANAHTVILLLLLTSTVGNVLFSSRETSQWWKERHARKYMQRLGVGPDLVMSKAIYIENLNSATSLNQTELDTLSGPW